MISKILLYSPNWIGDAVMAIPAVNSAKATFPESHLAVVGKDWVGEIYRIVPEVDEIITFDQKDRKPS